MDEVVEVDPSCLDRPKRAFLKRGEGTARRIYASRYKDEAKKKREENQRKAFEREELRRRAPPVQNDDRCIDLKDPSLKTFQRDEDETHDISRLERDPMQFSLDAVPEMDADNPFVTEGGILEEIATDGRCQVVSEGQTDGAMVAEVKRLRESQWLEMQRQHEDQQWTEAMELQEFEALERKIVEETRTKLENVEEAVKKKQVTFQEGSSTDDHSATPKTSRAKDTVGAKGTEERRSTVIQNSSVQKGSGRSQKGFQKLKSMSATRGAKTTASIGVAINRRTKDIPTFKSPAAAKILRTSDTLKCGLEKEFGDYQAEEVVVDSSFLDSLVEKDFCENHDPTFFEKKMQDTYDSSLDEKLKLQSLREEFESEKRQWEEKQVQTSLPAKIVAQFEATKLDEMKKIKRERRVLDQQSKALLKLPNKKERSEIESLEAALEAERKESRSKDARHKLTVERLKDQIHDLQVTKQELQEEVKWYEELQLKQAEVQGKENKSVATSPPMTVDASTETIAVQDPELEHGALNLSDSCGINPEDATKPSVENENWKVRLENPFYSEAPMQEYRTGQDAPAAQSLAERDTQCVFAPTLHPSSAAGIPFSNSNFDPVGMSSLHLQNQASNEADRNMHSRIVGYFPSERGTCSSSAFSAGGVMDAPPSFSQNLMLANAAQSGSSHLPFHAKSMAVGAPTLNQYGQPFTYTPRLNSHCAFDPRPAAQFYQNQAWLPQQTGIPQMPQLGASIPSLMSSGSCTISAAEPSLFSNRYPPTAVTPPPPQQDRTPLTSTVHRELPHSGGNNQSSHAHQMLETNSSRAVDTQSEEVGFRDATRGAEAQQRAVPGSEANRTSGSCRSREKEVKRPPKTRSSTESKQAPSVATFDNGTVKQTYPDGRAVVWFANGDVKHVHPGGRVEYFYADLNTWQVTHSTGIDVFYFDIGQVEAHRTNGDKDIIFPDGSMRLVLADGTEQDVTVDEVTPEIRNPKPEIPVNRPERRPQRRTNRKT